MGDEYKGITKKLLISPRTIDDKTVKDGLEAVSLLNEREQYYVVGGIATQSYLPTSCRRETSDIDLCLLRPLTYHSFKEMVYPLAEFLQDKGYSIGQRKGSRAFTLTYVSSDGNRLAIEAPKRNRANIDKHEHRLQREFDNSRKKILEGRDSTYRVTSPEDIAIPKLVRLINSWKRDSYLGGFLPSELGNLTDEEVSLRLKKINELREEAMTNPGDLELAQRVRFVSDLYDIRILSELTGFNEGYWREAENDWKAIGENPKFRKRILSVVLPNFNELDR